MCLVWLTRETELIS